MATVNKSSLRAEFDALKARFESLCAEGKMSADSRALFDALLMLFEVLMAVFMEKHTPKSSANSSLPASQSPNDNTARTRPGAKGKGPSHNDARCANTRTRESIRVLTVDACQRCGEDLTDAACLGHERRTLIDIVFEKVVRHADAQIKHCPRCHAETRACFPHQMPGPLQYGPGIKAYLVHLLIAQMLSLKRVAQSMHALIGRTLSEATLLGYVAQLHHALAEWERHAIERLLASPAMHVDETSLRVDRKNHWIHVYSAGTLTVKCLHAKRGREAIEAIGILPRYGGVAAGQPHIKSPSHQYLISEVIAEPRPNTLFPDTDLRCLTLQQVHRHMPNHTHIMGPIASTNPTLVFPERDVQPPMQPILDSPVPTYRVSK